LIKTREGSTLIIWLNAFHFDHFGSREHISELDWGSSLLLILYDLQDSLFYRVTLSNSFVVRISLVCVLVTSYKIEKTKLIYVIPKTNKSFITVANFFGDGHFLQKINDELTNNSLIGSWMIDIVISGRDWVLDVLSNCHDSIL
jgi:hypothetical protein